MLVTPGFIDVHTHYDGQAIWSRRLAPRLRMSDDRDHGQLRCWLRSLPEEDHGRLVSVMEGVEDIPEIVMTSGSPGLGGPFLNI